MADMAIAQGRIFNDVDILVPKSLLDKAEKALLRHGWICAQWDDYDQRYYRQWMHELPPLQHVRRKTVLDVHHNILPETARYHPSADLLFESAVAVTGRF